MAALAKSFPPSLQYSIAYDSTLFVTTLIRDVITTLFEAIGLVIVVVFLFLGSFRSSAIPMPGPGIADRNVHLLHSVLV